MQQEYFRQHTSPPERPQPLIIPMDEWSKPDMWNWTESSCQSPNKYTRKSHYDASRPLMVLWIGSANRHPQFTDQCPSSEPTSKIRSSKTKIAQIKPSSILLSQTKPRSSAIATRTATLIWILNMVLKQVNRKTSQTLTTLKDNKICTTCIHALRSKTKRKSA